MLPGRRTAFCILRLMTTARRAEVIAVSYFFTAAEQPNGKRGPFWSRTGAEQQDTLYFPPFILEAMLEICGNVYFH